MATSIPIPDRNITRHRSRPGERAVVGLLAVCAVVSVLVTLGIIAVLAGETISFFAKVPVLDFLTGTRWACLLYTSPSPRDRQKSRMPSSA